MKLIIQIPCYNEQDTLPVTLACLPRQVAGFDRVEWLVIDDGSRDATTETARQLGVDHVIGFRRRRGLAAAFMAGIMECVRLGADCIVNTDADNQYLADDIPILVRPILERQADLVIGARPIDEIRHFSFFKKKLQHLGSWIVRKVSRLDIPDATSGFRAMSRDAAMQINVYSDYTYTLETIIQAGIRNLAVQVVPIRVNEEVLRPSRLIRTVPAYLKKAFLTVLRIAVVYKPFQFFIGVGITLFSLGFLIGVRFLYFLLQGAGRGHVQSLILASILLGIGFQTILVAFLADLLSVNRKLLEEIQYRLRRSEGREHAAEPRESGKNGS